METIPKLGHNANAATCTDDSVCKTCNTKIASAKGHVAAENWEVSKKPTCEEDGLQVKKCTVCGGVAKSEIIHTDGHVDGDWEEVEKATCAKDGLSVSKCTICGKVQHTKTIPAGGHTESDWIEVKKVTCTEDGERVIKCTDCGEVL